MATRKPATRKPRPVAADNPNTEPLTVRVAPKLLEELDAWIARLNARGEGPAWDRSAVVRVLLGKALREKGAAGEAP